MKIQPLALNLNARKDILFPRLPDYATCPNFIGLYSTVILGQNFDHTTKPPQMYEHQFNVNFILLHGFTVMLSH